MKVEEIKKVSPVVITLETEEEIRSMYHALLMGFGDNGILTSGGANIPLPQSEDVIIEMYERFLGAIKETHDVSGW